MQVVVSPTISFFLYKQFPISDCFSMLNEDIWFNKLEDDQSGITSFSSEKRDDSALRNVESVSILTSANENILKLKAFIEHYNNKISKKDFNSNNQKIEGFK